MRLKAYLQEKYIGMDINKNYEVYENPTPTDFNMAVSYCDTNDKMIRFMADIKNKKVWIANASTIHSWMWRGCIKKYAKSKDASDTSTTVLKGIAEKRGGKWTMVASDSFDVLKNIRHTEVVKEIFSYDWKWVNKYIKVDKWIKDFKREWNL